MSRTAKSNSLPRPAVVAGPGVEQAHFLSQQAGELVLDQISSYL